jgi:hypothetical protein
VSDTNANFQGKAQSEAELRQKVETLWWSKAGWCPSAISFGAGAKYKTFDLLTTNVVWQHFPNFLV